MMSAIPAMARLDHYPGCRCSLLRYCHERRNAEGGN